MSEFNRALFRIDPTEGLLQYVQKVKPFRSKVLEVLVEYVYIEPMVITATERFHLSVGLPGFDGDETTTEITYANGYGISWDTLNPFAHGGVVNQAVVKSAVGLIQVPVTVGGSVITYIPDGSGYTFPNGTQVVFEAKPVSNLPANVNPSGPSDYDAGILPEGASSGERFYVIDSNPTTHTLSLSDSYNGPPKLFVTPGSGMVTLMPVTLPPTSPGAICAPFPYNTLVVEAPVYPSYSISVEDGTRGLFRFVDALNIEGISPATRSVDVSGNITLPVNVTVGEAVEPAPRLQPGASVTISGNTDASSNRQYTVSSVAFLGGTTSRITFIEPIPATASESGQVLIPVHDDFAPLWQSGTAVTLASPMLPSQVQDINVFFQQTSPVGAFKLSRSRYPTEAEQFITLPNGTPPSFTITRKEPVVPGERFTLSDTLNGANNGIYTVQNVAQEGAFFRVQVREHISTSTPVGAVTDGIIRSGGTFGSPTGVPMSSSSLLIAANMHERISFDFGPIPVSPYVFDTFAGVGNLLNREGDSGHTWMTFNDNSDDLTELFLNGDGYVRSADTNIWAKSSWAVPAAPCLVEVTAQVSPVSVGVAPYVRIFAKESNIATFAGPHVDVFAEDTNGDGVGTVTVRINGSGAEGEDILVTTPISAIDPVVVRMELVNSTSVDVHVNATLVFSSGTYEWPTLTTVGFNFSNPTGDPSKLGIATFRAEEILP